MPHIHTGEGEHDLTASAFIVRDFGPFVGFSILMHQHKTLDRILQPGGHVELTENPFQAVLREITEETGYLPHQLSLMQRGANGRLTINTDNPANVQPFYVNTHQIQENPKHFHTDLSYVFFTDSLSVPIQKPAKGESTKLQWLSRDEIIVMPNIPRNVRHIALMVFNSI